jgi:hypothetical protein
MDYAEEHRFSARELLDLLGHPERAPGEKGEFGCAVPFGYYCVFTIDEQPAGWMRNLSVGLPSSTKWPHEKAVEMLAREFGFKTPFEKWHKYLEEDVRAVNVLELLDPQPK